MKQIIKYDIDSSLLPLWKNNYIKTRKAMLEALGYKLDRIILRKSGESLPWQNPKTEGKGWHAWLHIETPKPLTELERLELAFLLGDDPGRTFINYLRITKRKSPHWDKIFGYVSWRAPLDPICAECRLRKTIEELSKDVVNPPKH